MVNFNLEKISSIIVDNNYKNVALYFLEDFFYISSDVTLKLKESNRDVNFMIMITCSSGVDTMQWRLNSKDDSPDCVIYFGTSCLCRSRYSTQIPTYFVPVEKDPGTQEYIEDIFRQEINNNSAQKVLLLSDLTHSEYLNICDKFNCSIDICQYLDFDQNNLKLLQNTKSKFVCEILPENHESSYYPFIFPQKLSDYDLVLFIGECKNLELILNSRQIVILEPNKKSFETFDGSKEFRRRISLIEKFKNQAKMVGIVFLNYTSTVSPVMEQTKIYCRKQKRAPFFLTLNQTDYELRLGNFTQLDAFVLVNVCECNFEIAQKTSKYFSPIIFWREFLIISKQKILYGGIEWNNEECVEEEDEEEENDEQMMQIVEREMFQIPKDSWYGLIVDAGNSEITDHIQQGLSGIASGYRTENDLF